MRGVGDDARKPGAVEQPFLLVEIPAPVLLRHEAALEPVGELGHGALQMDELLVQIGAQARQFLLVAQLLRGDGFIEHLGRSEEHTSELQSLMRISYAVFCLKKKKNLKITIQK